MNIMMFEWLTNSWRVLNAVILALDEVKGTHTVSKKLR